MIANLISDRQRLVADLRDVDVEASSKLSNPETIVAILSAVEWKEGEEPTRRSVFGFLSKLGATDLAFIAAVFLAGKVRSTAELFSNLMELASFDALRALPYLNDLSRFTAEELVLLAKLTHKCIAHVESLIDEALDEETLFPSAQSIAQLERNRNILLVGDGLIAAAMGVEHN